MPKNLRNCQISKIENNFRFGILSWFNVTQRKIRKHFKQTWEIVSPILTTKSNNQYQILIWQNFKDFFLNPILKGIIVLEKTTKHKKTYLVLVYHLISQTAMTYCTFSCCLPIVGGIHIFGEMGKTQTTTRQITSDKVIIII